MTRLYQDRGTPGVEELALIVGRYLGGLIDLVFAWGGDIEKLYGDAFLAFWPASEPDRDDAVRSALGCASVMVALRQPDNGRRDRVVAKRCAGGGGFVRSSGRRPIWAVALFLSGAEPIQSFGHARRCAAGKYLQFRRSAIRVSEAAGACDLGRRGKDGGGATYPGP